MEYKAAFIHHRNEERIAVWFDNQPELIARLKKLGDARWSATKKVWHLPNTAENRLRFKLNTPSQTNLATDKVAHLEKFKRYLNTKRYSENTVKTYTEALKTFFLFYDEKEVNEIDNEDVVRFHHEYIIKKNLSSSFQNQIINAVNCISAPLKKRRYRWIKFIGPKGRNYYPMY